MFLLGLIAIVCASWCAGYPAIKFGDPNNYGDCCCGILFGLCVLYVLRVFVVLISRFSMFCMLVESRFGFADAWV